MRRGIKKDKTQRWYKTKENKDIDKLSGGL